MTARSHARGVAISLLIGLEARCLDDRPPALVVGALDLRERLAGRPRYVEAEGTDPSPDLGIVQRPAHHFLRSADRPHRQGPQRRVGHLLSDLALVDRRQHGDGGGLAFTFPAGCPDLAGERLRHRGTGMARDVGPRRHAPECCRTLASGDHLCPASSAPRGRRRVQEIRLPGVQAVSPRRTPNEPDVWSAKIHALWCQPAGDPSRISGWAEYASARAHRRRSRGSEDRAATGEDVRACANKDGLGRRRTEVDSGVRCVSARVSCCNG